MRILIITHFGRMPQENGNSRFNYLANLLKNKQHDVEIITSSFSHSVKKQREFSKEDLNSMGYKITLIEEPGYKKNVSLKRMYSHYKMAKNLKKYLNSINEKVDIIYCAVPSLDVAKVSAKFAKKNNIRFIIDIQDLWPEAFKMVFNIPIISNMIFYPIKKNANYVYKCADDIVAVSETYADRAASVNKKYKNKLSVFLGTELKFFDKCKEENKVEYNDNLIRLAYIGTLGSSYDLKCTIDALGILKEQGINIKFLVMGQGPLKEEFEEYARKKNIDCIFTGLLEYKKMVGMLCACDIAVNPIKHNAAQSIINKVGDYAAAGLPVINTLECEEYRNIVDTYKIGFNCNNENAFDMAEKLKYLIENEEVRKTMGRNNRKLAEEKFDRAKTYNKIYELVINSGN